MEVRRYGGRGGLEAMQVWSRRDLEAWRYGCEV
jgi:hypothetical protein